MSARTFTPLWPDVEPLIAARQPGRRMPRANSKGWIGPMHSPLRDDDAVPSFSVLPDSETDPGAYKDHGTDEGGSMVDLARRLGVEIKNNGNGGSQPAAPPSPTATLDDFGRARRLDPGQLRDLWGVREGGRSGRRGLLYPTPAGVERIKFTDGAEPKYKWAGVGGHAHWYGLDRALELAGRAAEAEQGFVYVVNGEPSVWACSQVGVPAVCLCAGEGTPPTSELAAELQAAGFDTVKVIYDLDDAGRKGAPAVAEALRAAGLDAVALELPADLGVGGDVDDLHRRVGDGLAAALAGLPILDPNKVNENLSASERAVAALWRPVGLDCLKTPPRRRDWLLTQPVAQGGHGVLARGKVGILAAEGGTGKTAGMVGLAVAAITGRRWLDYFEVPATVTGRVLLALAEEDADDAHRHLWRISESLLLTEFERDMLAERLVILPLAGVSVALTTIANGGLVETPLAVMIRERLAREAGEDGWALIGLDPLSRFAGGDVEGSNEAATRFVETVESFAAVPGHPAVLVSAHSSKLARRQGQADVRGVTGLSDAARWVATMRREGEEVIFAVVKSNYTLPTPPLRLRWHEGTLAAVSGAEILDAAVTAQKEQAAEIDDDVRRVVEVLGREGTMTSRDSIARVAGLRAARGRAALDLAITRGLVRASGTDRHRSYAAVPEMCVQQSPHTPPPSGTDGRTGVCPSRPGWDGPGRTGTDRTDRK